MVALLSTARTQRHRKHVTARRVIAAVAGLGFAASLAAVVPGPAQARATPTITFTEAYGASVAVSSSTHHKLKVSTYISEQTGDTPDLHVTVALPNGHETHSWTFPLPSSALHLDAKGSGTFKATSKQLGGFGALSLKVAASGATKQFKCQSQLVSATRHATISGAFSFDTKSHWGKIKGKRFTFARTSDVYWAYDNTASCGQTRPPCASYNSWSLSKSSGHGFLSMYGGTSGKHGYASASRSQQLSKPAGANRYDYLSTTTKHPPKLTVKSDHTATMVGYAGKGSVTIKASDPATPSTIPCGNGSKNVAITSWFSATLHQNKPPAKLSAQIYGAIQVPNSGTASISRVKVVK
jgi:hypothetical protein